MNPENKIQGLDAELEIEGTRVQKNGYEVDHFEGKALATLVCTLYASNTYKVAWATIQGLELPPLKGRWKTKKGVSEAIQRHGEKYASMKDDAHLGITTWELIFDKDITALQNPKATNQN